MSNGSCSSGAVSCWISSQVDIMANIAKSLLPIEKLITGAAYLIGLSFIFKAIHSLKIYGESRTMMSSNTNFKEPMVYFIVGAILLYLPSGISMVLNTTFGTSTVLAYSAINSANPVLGTLFGPESQVGNSLALIIQVIGLIAFIRGWTMVAKSASQGQPPGGTGKGLMHVFGGILAMNIVGTLQIINNTLYGSG